MTPYGVNRLLGLPDEKDPQGESALTSGSSHSLLLFSTFLMPGIRQSSDRVARSPGNVPIPGELVSGRSAEPKSMVLLSGRRSCVCICQGILWFYSEVINS